MGGGFGRPSWRIRCEHLLWWNGGDRFQSTCGRRYSKTGFRVKNPGGENPRYLVRYSDNNEREPLICFSKKFDDPWNPLNDIIAVMTCSDADRHCPSVPGADYRISIPFDDPKQADNSPLESQVYDERCRQIATEMLYMISELDS